MANPDPFLTILELLDLQNAEIFKLKEAVERLNLKLEQSTRPRLEIKTTENYMRDGW
jgi:hypothetical protein